MNNSKMFLAVTIMFAASLNLNAQYSKKDLAKRDSIIDSLRNQSIPEADLGPYSNYLLKKHSAHKDNNPSYVTHIDSSVGCYNPGFEFGDLTNWSGVTGNCCPLNIMTPGLIPGRHTVTSGTATDPWSQGDIPVLAPAGGNFSARLGNDNVGGEAEKFLHTFQVTAQTTSFTYQYAVVLQDPSHPASDQPRFEVKVYDQSGNLTPCGYYQVTAAGSIPGFISVNDIRYKKWTTVGIDLSAYVGQYITIEFTTSDCGYGGHFGYAYIDATCEPLKIKKKFCLGDSTAILTAPDGFSDYTWSTGHHGQTITINHPQNGDTVFAYLTSVTGCPTTLYAILEQEEAPTSVTATGDTLICPGETVQLHASGSEYYAWHTSTDTTAFSSDMEPYVSPILSTDYVAVVYNACGSLTDTVTVNVKPYTPLVASNDTNVCMGIAVPLHATGNDSCIWSPANGLSCTNCNDPVATVTQTSTFIVSAIDTTSGCLLRDSVTIKVDSALISVYAGPDQSICEGSTVYLGAYAYGTTNLNWVVSDSSLTCYDCADALANPISTTTYTLTGSNACQTITDSVTITVFPKPVVDAGAYQSVCFGDTITFHGTGGASNTDYQWSPEDGLSCANCSDPVLIVGGNNTFYLSVHNAGGCFASDTVSVHIRSTFNVTTGDQLICEGLSVQLNASGDSSKPIIWVPSTGLSCDTCYTTVSTPSVSTTYYAVGSDSTSCKGIDVVTISIINTPVAEAGPEKNICTGSYVYLPGSGGDTYEWYPAQHISCTSCSNPQVNPDTTTMYYLIATNICGSDTDSVKVNVHQPPVVAASNDQSICTGLPGSLSSSGASTYTWSPASGLSCVYCASPNIIAVTSTATYTVTGTDQFGCSSTDEVTITALPLPTIDAGSNASSCVNVNYTLTPGGTVNQPVWSPATGLTCTNCANPVATPASTTTYTITVTDPVNGCLNTDAVTLTINYPPTIVASSGQDLCNGSSASLFVSGGDTYQWTPSTGLSCSNCTSPIASPSVVTTYTVVATNGCGTDQATITLNVLNNIPVSAGNDQSGCIGDVFHMNATGGNTGATYVWTPTTGLSCTNCASPSYTAGTTSTFTVTAFNTNACYTSDEVVVTASVKPTIGISVNYDIDCGGLSAAFKDTIGTTQNYFWDFGDGSTSSGGSINHYYSDPSKPYTVVVTASNGSCTVDTSITTTTIDLTNILKVPNIFTPNNDGKNDCFFVDVINPYAAKMLNCGTITIFDRWGIKVFSGNLTDCWNGQMNGSGKAVSDGTYFYVIEMDNNQRQGFIQLSR